MPWLIGLGLTLGVIAIVRAFRGASTPTLPAIPNAVKQATAKTAFAAPPTTAASSGTVPMGALANLPVPPQDTWAKVEHEGRTYLVAPVYLGPARIGEAADLAASRGWTLPSPKLVDAIWSQADLKLMPIPQTNLGMSAALAAKQASAIEAQIAGRDFTLLGGSHKDIVTVNGKHGIYGWHVANEDIPAFTKKAGFDPRKIGGPAATPGLAGAIIQGANTTSHDASYGDYSQGLRPIIQLT
jgi:hypothetical protein